MIAGSMILPRIPGRRWLLFRMELMGLISMVNGIMHFLSALVSMGIWVQVITQGELVADSLKDYLHRHPEMDRKCTKGGRCVYRTTESEEKFTESASTFLNESIRVERIEL